MAVTEEAYSPAGAHEEAAHLRIATSLPANDLRAVLDDVERLYRINPLLEISAFEPAGQARYHLVAHNYSNGNNADILLAVTTKETGLEIATATT